MSVKKETTWESNWEIKTLFSKASATFIGRLICLDMQGEQWMKNAWEGFVLVFSTTVYDTKH